MLMKTSQLICFDRRKITDVSGPKIRCGWRPCLEASCGRGHSKDGFNQSTVAVTGCSVACSVARAPAPVILRCYLM